MAPTQALQQRDAEQSNQTPETTPPPEPAETGASATRADLEDAGETASRVCGSCQSQVVTEGTETFCPECGLVVETDRIDRGPEWRRAASRSDDSGRNTERVTGAPLTPLLHDRGLGSNMGNSQSEAHSTGGRAASRQRRLDSIDRAQASGQLRETLSELQRTASALDVPGHVTNRAAYLLRTAHQEEFFVGRSLELVIGAGIYAACREQDVVRLPRDVVEALRIQVDDLNGEVSVRDRLFRLYGDLCRELGLTPRPLGPAAYLPRLESALDISQAVSRRARQLANAASNDTATTGRSPSILAAACVWRASREADGTITAGDAGDVVDATPKGVRNARDALLETDAIEDATRL